MFYYHHDFTKGAVHLHLQYLHVILCVACVSAVSTTVRCCGLQVIIVLGCSVVLCLSRLWIGSCQHWRRHWLQCYRRYRQGVQGSVACEVTSLSASLHTRTSLTSLVQNAWVCRTLARNSWRLSAIDTSVEFPALTWKEFMDVDADSMKAKSRR